MGTAPIKARVWSICSENKELRAAKLVAASFLSSFTRGPLSTLVVPRLGLKIARTAVVTAAAAGGVAAIPPRAWGDRSVVSGTESLFGRRHLKAKHAALGAVSSPPATPQDWTPMTLAEPLAGRRHFLGSIALRAARVAMARTPVAGPDWPAVKLAKPLLARTNSLRPGLVCSHTSA